jgi:hypothetical protein
VTLRELIKKLDAVGWVNTWFTVFLLFSFIYLLVAAFVFDSILAFWYVVALAVAAGRDGMKGKL